MGLQLNGSQGILVLDQLSPAVRRAVLRANSQRSEDFLVERAIKRDRVAFTALYDSHVDRVYRHVYYWVRSQVDAEDITQEVFVRAWKYIDKYQIKGAPFIAWLTVIARNLITDHHRAKKKFVSLEETEVAGDENTDPQTMVESSFDQRMVRDAIFKLKGEQQRVIMLRFIDGLSFSEIAAALNKNEGAVRVLQFRALKGLRRILGSTK